MTKDILILGGAGFIGFNIAKRLSKESNNKIIIADNLARGKRDRELSNLLEKDNVSLIEGDFTKASTFNKLKNEYDYFYMLASVVGVNNTLSIPDEVIRINSMLILNSLEWLKKGGAKSAVFSSTSENYAGTIDEFGYKVPTPEEIPLSITDISHPRYTYAVTKILGESGFLNFGKRFGFNSTIVRYHNVIGPRMGFKHVIPHLVERFLIKKENPFQVYGHDQTRAFCYISDAVDGTIRACESKKSNNEIYHIGTDEEITIKDLIEETGSYLGFEGSYENAPTFPGSTNRRCPDISKAKKHLGYQPKIGWREALHLTLDWYKDFFESGERAFETSFEKPKDV